jgi:hypothetical protein
MSNNYYSYDNEYNKYKNIHPDNYVNTNAFGYGSQYLSKDYANNWNPIATEPNRYPTDYYTYGMRNYDDYVNPYIKQAPIYNLPSLRSSHDSLQPSHDSLQLSDDPLHLSDDPLHPYLRRNDCQEFPIVYRMVNGELDCDNIVELKIPFGGSKEMYLAKFSPEFIRANIYQCATVPVYNTLPNNVIDNMRAVEFTLSDQAALTKRGINNHMFAIILVYQ